LADWLKNKDRRVVVGDPKTFATEWFAWWWSLQPSWRRLDEVAGQLSRNVPQLDPWPLGKHLCQGGKNGFVLCVISLSWWLRGIRDSTLENPINVFKSAVDDVRWTAREMSIRLDGSVSETHLPPTETDVFTIPVFLVLLTEKERGMLPTELWSFCVLISCQSAERELQRE
jgi:hypothetical protein